jgi:DNA-binding Lrp family transcriptional regulator
MQLDETDLEILRLLQEDVMEAAPEIWKRWKW